MFVFNPQMSGQLDNFSDPAETLSCFGLIRDTEKVMAEMNSGYYVAMNTEVSVCDWMTLDEIDCIVK